MADLLGQLEAFVREQRGAAAAEEESTWRTRLEQKVDALAKRQPERSRRELLEELAADDDFLAELERELVAEADELEPAGDEDAGDEDGGEDDGEDGGSDSHDDPEGIRWRRVELEVPRIYSGDDEPEHVEYLDEEGRTRVRAGRRRGQPVTEEWEELEVDDQGDDDDAGDEPGEEEE